MWSCNKPIQTTFGPRITAFDPVQTTGKEGYGVAMWAQRVQIAERSLRNILAFSQHRFHPIDHAPRPKLSHISRCLRRWPIPFLQLHVLGAVRRRCPHLSIRALQFVLAMFIVDACQYSSTVLCSGNKLLATNFHSLHHYLSVPMSTALCMTI